MYLAPEHFAEVYAGATFTTVNRPSLVICRGQTAEALEQSARRRDRDERAFLYDSKLNLIAEFVPSIRAGDAVRVNLWHRLDYERQRGEPGLRRAAG